MNCKNCRDANCYGAKQDREIEFCLWYDPPKTNADRFRAMSNEELAEAFVKNCLGRKCTHTDSCRDCWLDWLQKEAE